MINDIKRTHTYTYIRKHTHIQTYIIEDTIFIEQKTKLSNYFNDIYRLKRKSQTFSSKPKFT